MPPKTKILCVIGTRPEAIKMAPLIALLCRSAWADVKVVVTAQHRDLLDPILQHFHIKATVDFNVMQPNQSLAGLTAKLLTQFDALLQAEQPDAVLAQGDTTTVLTAALACFYARVPFGHVEAGLRTGDLALPFPEEGNRVLASRLARWHFAPTAQARQNLLAEGVDDQNIVLTGNTVIDALLETAEKPAKLPVQLQPNQRMLLLTVHRREHFGETLRGIFQAILHLAQQHKEIVLLYPVHPNPNVRELAYKLLGAQENIVLTDPLAYPVFVSAMQQAYCILTDSGGVQEEAPALGTPVLVLREDTERPEAVAQGGAQLVGTQSEHIIAAVNQLFEDKALHQRMSLSGSPYGDGRAAERIVARLKVDLQHEQSHRQGRDAVVV